MVILFLVVCIPIHCRFIGFHSISIPPNNIFGRDAQNSNIGIWDGIVVFEKIELVEAF
jgi:hypothetical protein